MKQIRPLPRSYFENYAEDSAEDRTYSSNWQDYGFQRFLDYLKLLKQSYTPEPGTVLETGSASGKIIQELRGRGIRARGIEFSRHILHECDLDTRKYIARGNAVELVKCMPTSCFDCVYETCAEYIPQELLPEYFRNLHRILRKDLVILLHTVEEDSEPHPGQVTHLHNSEWFKLIEQAGFVTGHSAAEADPVPFYFKKV